MTIKSRIIPLVAGVSIALVSWVAGVTDAQTEDTGLPEVNGWRLAASMLVPRSEHAVAELDGKIYVIGGYPPGRIPSEVVQVYDVASDRWELGGPPLPVHVHHAMAAGLGGKLYVIGGGTRERRDGRAIDVHEYGLRA